jgi:hypothetical protein
MPTAGWAQGQNLKVTGLAVQSCPQKEPWEEGLGMYLVVEHLTNSRIHGALGLLPALEKHQERNKKKKNSEIKWKIESH